MLPILFRLPLPHWTLPLGPAFGALSVLGALIAVVGWRRGARELLLIGGAFALLSVPAAVLLHGQSFQLGPIPVPGYGALLGVALVGGWHLTLRLGERAGFPRELLAAAYFVTTLSGFAGARLLYVLVNAREFSGAWDLLAVRHGGLSAYGGFLGGLLGAWWFLRSRRVSLAAWVDLVAPGLASGIVFTRLGCYSFGCDFGRPLTSAAPGWLQRLGTFPRWSDGTHAWASGSPAWFEHVTARGLSPAAPASLPVHPTQLYEAIGGALLLGLVVWMRARARFRGQVFLALALGYGVLRFLIETLRDDGERGLLGPALAGHWLVAVGLAAIGAACAFAPVLAAGSVRIRRGLLLVSFAPGLFAWLALRPGQDVRPLRIEPSISLWLSLSTALAAAAVWRRLQRASAPSLQENKV